MVKGFFTFVNEEPI